MLIKSALFACVVAAAAAGGCRDDRNERTLEFGRSIEATELPASGQGAGQNAEQPTTRTDEAGHTVHVTGADRPAQPDPQPTTGADVQARSDAGVPPGTSETATGTGTTTDTGINTENQGTGGTDDPTR